MSFDGNEFDPVLLSKEENLFLFAHLGEAPVLAMRALTDPIVNPKAVKPILEKVYELEQLRQHEGQEWAGIERIKQAIQTYLKQDAKWEADAKRSRKAPRFPSLYSYDAKGRPHRAGPGSDSGRVRTYFGPAGERIPFAVPLVSDGLMDWEGPLSTETPTDMALYVDPDASRIECRVKVGEAGNNCGHTESYKSGSRASYNAARQRMSKHLVKATENPEDHRAVHTNEFGGGTAE